MAARKASDAWVAHQNIAQNPGTAGQTIFALHLGEIEL
jgi:hypothetical protein